MIRASARPRQLERWVCSSCLRQRAALAVLQPREPRQLAQVRSLHSVQRSQQLQGEKQSQKQLASPFPSRQIRHYAYVAPTDDREDDNLLRTIFDKPSFWQEYSALPIGMNVGLFQNAYLTSPKGFETFANVSLARARRIVDRVLNAYTVPEYRRIVRELDRLSDTLCRVLDMADFVRVTHPDHKIQRAANAAWDTVYQYMNELNTMTGLYEQLDRAMKNPEVTKVWSEEEKAVAEVLRQDFLKSAVNLPKWERDRFVQLSSKISTVATAFVHEMTPDQAWVAIPSSKMRGMDPVQVRSLTRNGMVYVPTLSAQAALALRTVHDPEARKMLYYASRTSSARSVSTLEMLMRLRAELAELSGFESYAQMALRDRMMARSPEAVDKFLRALAGSNKPRAVAEFGAMLREKQKTVPDAEALEPWDREYYSTILRKQATASERAPRTDVLSSFFSLGTVIQGLSRIFNLLYGIRFAPRPPLRGETWHPDVRRLDVVHDTEGRVAVLYCDLFYRADKSPNPAHFTLRCSREILPEEMDEVWQEQMSQAPRTDMPYFQRPEFAANDGMAFSKIDGKVKQLPTIALVCDFPQNNDDSQPVLLSYFQVETLFHEMGHAIHSILARTSFQNVAGTRCATDLAELPSTLMEYFVADPSVLSVFARHYETDDPVPYALVSRKIRQARLFEGSDTENQIILAMLDQALHSRRARDDAFDSTQIFHDLQREFGSGPPDPRGTRWQGFFGHLSGYGSTYYSYLFDRVLAQRTWEVVFKGGAGGAALDRANGEHLKNSLLKWGGGRDPWKCLAAVLNEPKLEDGGEEAMALVGSWGAARQQGGMSM